MLVIVLKQILIPSNCPIHPTPCQENHEINLAVHLLWRTFVKNYILLWQKTV